MSYSNYFELKVEGKIKKNIKFCKCENTQDIKSVFCPICGSKLEEKEIEIDANYVIEELVNRDRRKDCYYLLEKNGKTKSSGSGNNIQREITEFSRKYKELTFILSCQWESGLVDTGQPGTDFYFIKNGACEKAICEIKYTNPFNNESFIFKK